MQFFLLLFILVPIIEIGVFIQVGNILGLGPTILVVFITAIIGVNLLKQQGLKAWADIQGSMAQGQVPALEMASAAQLLFAGALLLTPGFVTDAVGLALMIPAVRLAVARQLMQRWSLKVTSFSKSAEFRSGFQAESSAQSQHPHNRKDDSGRTIEGEFEERS